jgi:ATP/maltotriose-dependent transcriptional regulator MalT
MDYLLSGPLSLSFLNIELAHIKGAVLLEVLLLTYAILYRMKAIKEENLIKQTELKIFLKRQEMTARQKTERHIEDVYLENVIMQYDLDGFEVKLLQFISEGKTNEKIARKLKVTQDELEEATNELYQKLEIREHIKEDYHLVDSQPDFIYN